MYCFQPLHCNSANYLLVLLWLFFFLNLAIPKILLLFLSLIKQNVFLHVIYFNVDKVIKVIIANNKNNTSIRHWCTIMRHRIRPLKLFQNINSWDIFWVHLQLPKEYSQKSYYKEFRIKIITKIYQVVSLYPR